MVSRLDSHGGASKCGLEESLGVGLEKFSLFYRVSILEKMKYNKNVKKRPLIHIFNYL